MAVEIATRNFSEGANCLGFPSYMTAKAVHVQCHNRTQIRFGLYTIRANYIAVASKYTYAV